MASIRSKGMKPEMMVRSLAHAMGYRYRLHAPDLPGKPDLVFRSRKKVIFVHGCFWHQHGKSGCLDGRMPKSRLEYWEPKLARNINRDQQNLAALLAMGWSVLTVWDCETKSQDEMTDTLQNFLS